MKYIDIKKNSPVETYENNLFLAVSDMFWDLVFETEIDHLSGFTEDQARKIIIRDVNDIINESVRQFRDNDIQ